MADSEEPQRAFAPLLRAAFGGLSAQVVYVAAKLGLPDLIRDGHRTAFELAGQLGVDPAALGRIMRGLVALGLCAENADGQFALSPLGEYLRADHSDSVRSRVILNAEVHAPLWADILTSVRTGESASQRVFGAPFYEHLARHPELGSVFDRAMTSAGWIRYRFRPAVEAYDFGRFARIVDVGGGNGTLMVELLRTYARPEGIVFDIPRLAEAARRTIDDAKLTARCTFVAGDAFEAVPAGADAYVLSNFLISTGDEEALAVLRNCRKAIAPDGRLLLVEWLMTAEHEPTTGFRFWDTVIMDLVMLAAFGSRSGFVRTRPDFQRLLGMAGFSLTAVLPTTASVYVIEAVPKPGD
jgi:SAM-dependent methyltransferase